MANNNIESVLQYINKNFVTLADGDVKENNPLLSEVLDEITKALKSVNNLFSNMFETYIYGGSFFDGLKVSEPDEYDIDLKLLLPKILDVQIEPSDRDGFVYIKLKDWNRLTYDTKLYSLYKDLEKLKDSENYLSQVKIKQWMQSIVQKAINKIREDGTLDHIQLSQRMSGPAVTLNVKHLSKKMDIDLVAVFRIPGVKWPESPVRQNTNRIFKDFLVVPKPPKDVAYSERYWRLSFPEQEREMIKGWNTCKTTIRLLKKLRDTRKHNIPSYFIKTVFLWEIEEREKRGRTIFWNGTLKNVFLEMLEIYKSKLEYHEIPYFWNKNNNFLQHLSSRNIANIKNYLEGMIKDIERNIDSNPYIIANYLLPTNELNQLKIHFNPIILHSCVTPVTQLWNREPAEIPVNRYSVLQTEEEEASGISTGTMIAGAAAVGIGAAVLGLFAYARSQRNQNN